MVVQQVNQQFAPPPTLLRKEKKDKSEKGDRELTLRKKSVKKMRYLTATFIISISSVGLILECSYSAHNLTRYTKPPLDS